MKILAPISGIPVPLELIPDPVFSGGMAGLGLAIDPTDAVLRAPADATVSFLHPSKHALSLLCANGAELLLHIGIDTVALKGEGFEALVKTGDKVKRGTPLIRFDADLVARKAKSLLTEVLLTNTAAFRLNILHRGAWLEAGKDPLFEILSGSGVSVSQAPPGKAKAAFSAELVIANQSGLHARPAAVLASAAREFSCGIFLAKAGRRANAKSVVSLLTLEVAANDPVTLIAEGEGAEAAVAKLMPLIRSGLGEAVRPANTREAKKAPEQKNGAFLGVGASPGLAAGRIFHYQPDEIFVDSAKGRSSAEETARLNEALKEAREEIRNLLKEIGSESERASIFEAHAEFLEDPELYAAAELGIRNGKNAATAWKEAFLSYAASLGALQNELLAGRASDVRDVGTRVLRLLTGAEKTKLDIPENSILVAKSLTPSDTIRINPESVLGFCSVEGGASSHVAILARAMGIPYVTALSESVLAVPPGTSAILDAAKGTLQLSPSEAELLSVRGKLQKQSERNRKNLENAHKPAVTADGKTIELFANIGELGEAEEAARMGAEGVGLLRSEFLFLHRASAPDEEAQTAAYREVMSALPGKPVTFRTLDIGGDKPLPYLALPQEENPFLGVRGLRVSLRHLELFRTQLRALLRLSPAEHVRIMFPMVTSLEELREAKRILEEERAKLNAPRVEVGMMVEVPSAALLAHVFAPEVDFFSVGSNDLTQYVLAMDRGHKDLAREADGMHPAVLQLIGKTVEAARAHGKWVGVCGGIAGDSSAVPVLLGLGVDELSVSVPAVPAVKAQVRALSAAACRSLAERVLKESKNAVEARAIVKSEMGETL